MTQEENFVKNREESLNQKDDHRVISDQATVYGAIGMTVVVLVLCGIRVFMKGEHLYDILAIYAGYFVASSIYRYKFLKRKKELVLAFCWIIIAVVWIVLYVLKG